MKLIAQDQEDLLSLCQEFEMANIQVPVISICETQETKLSRNLLLGRWKSQALLVGRKADRLAVEVIR